MGGMVISKADFAKDHFKSGSNIKEEYEIAEISESSLLGEIHTCVNHRTRIKRSVKIIQKESLGVMECERLREETRIIKQMDHPNIVTLYECY